MTVLAFNFLYGKPTVQRFETKRDALGERNDWFLPESPEELAEQYIIAPTAKMLDLCNELSAYKRKEFPDRIAGAHRLFEIGNKLSISSPTNRRPEVDALSDKEIEEMAKSNNTARAALSTTKAAEASGAVAAKAGPEVKKIATGERALTTGGKPKAAAKAAPAKKAAAKAPAKAPAKKAPAKAPSGAAGRGRTSPLAGHTLTHALKLDADKSPINPRRPGSHGHKSLSIIIDAGSKGISTEDFLKAGGRMNDLNWDISHDSVKAKKA